MRMGEKERDRDCNAVLGNVIKFSQGKVSRWKGRCAGSDSGDLGDLPLTQLVL